MQDKDKRVSGTYIHMCVIASMMYDRSIHYESAPRSGNQGGRSLCVPTMIGRGLTNGLDRKVNISLIVGRGLRLCTTTPPFPSSAVAKAVGQGRACRYYLWICVCVRVYVLLANPPSPGDRPNLVNSLLPSLRKCSSLPFTRMLDYVYTSE